MITMCRGAWAAVQKQVGWVKSQMWRADVVQQFLDLSVQLMASLRLDLASMERSAIQWPPWMVMVPEGVCSS